MKIIVVLFLALVPSSGFAISQISNGLQAASATGGSILANPPLPMLSFKSGDKLFSIQPAYAEGTMDGVLPAAGGSNGSRELGRVYGGGAAVAYTHALGDSLGLYFLGVGAQIGGDFTSTAIDGAGVAQNTIEARQIQSTFLSAGVGLTWTAVGGGQDDAFSLGLFGGPALAHFAINQRIVNTNSSGSVTDDFDMETRVSLPSTMVGLQAGFKFADLLVNPYFVGFTSFADSSCYDYSVGRVRIDGSLDGSSTTNCGGDGMGGGTTRNKVDVIDGIQGFGVNLAYEPLNLGVNLYSNSGEPKGLKGFQARSYFVTISIGTK